MTMIGTGFPGPTGPTGPAGKVGLIGKIPAHGDYLRLDAADPAALALFDWLQQTVELAHRLPLPLPEGPSVFFQQAQGGAAAVAGVLVPSSDRVGRSFPLAVFFRLPPRDAVRSAPLLPLAGERFFLDAAALLDEAETLPSGAALMERARGLIAPTADELASGEQRFARWLRETPSGVWLATGHEQADQPESQVMDTAALSFELTLSACQLAARQSPGKGAGAISPVALRLAVGGPGAVCAWLSVITERLRWPELAVSYVYRPNPPGGTLVVCLGPLIPPALHAASPVDRAGTERADRLGAKVWSTGSISTDAVARARAALPPRLSSRLAPTTPVGDLLALVRTE